MKGRRRKKDWGEGYDSPSLRGGDGDYDHVTGESTMKRRSRGLGIRSSGGGGYDFSGTTGIGVGYDSFTGIRPKDRHRNKQSIEE